MNYRAIQLTNTNIPAVNAGDALPLGTITRSVRPNPSPAPTMVVSTSQADTITLNEIGNYNIGFFASLVSSAAGEVSVGLELNGSIVYTASATATEGGTVPLSFVYQAKAASCCSVLPTSCPVSVRFVLSGEGITGGTSNVLVERVLA